MGYNLSEMDSLKTDNQLFGIVTDAMQQMYAMKNHDYGNSFSELFKKFGLISAVVRIGDKYNRLASLCQSGAQAEIKDETIEDTLLDMANYCIMTVIELEKKAKKERMN